MKFKELLKEDVNTFENKKKLKEFKKLLNAAYQYGYRNLESDWAEGTVLYSLQKVIDSADKLKGK